MNHFWGLGLPCPSFWLEPVPWAASQFTQGQLTMTHLRCTFCTPYFPTLGLWVMLWVEPPWKRTCHSLMGNVGHGNHARNFCPVVWGATESCCPLSSPLGWCWDTLQTAMPWSPGIVQTVARRHGQLHYIVLRFIVHSFLPSSLPPPTPHPTSSPLLLW